MAILLDFTKQLHHSPISHLHACLKQMWPHLCCLHHGCGGWSSQAYRVLLDRLGLQEDCDCGPQQLFSFPELLAPGPRPLMKVQPQQQLRQTGTHGRLPLTLLSVVCYSDRRSCCVQRSERTAGGRSSHGEYLGPVAVRSRLKHKNRIHQQHSGLSQPFYV